MPQEVIFYSAAAEVCLGIFITVVKPSPSTEENFTVPPRASVRSRMPRRPLFSLIFLTILPEKWISH